MTFVVFFLLKTKQFLVTIVVAIAIDPLGGEPERSR